MLRRACPAVVGFNCTLRRTAPVQLKCWSQYEVNSGKMSVVGREVGGDEGFRFCLQGRESKYAVFVHEAGWINCKVTI